MELKLVTGLPSASMETCAPPLVISRIALGTEATDAALMVRC